jgi:hypothetical protein
LQALTDPENGTIKRNPAQTIVMEDAEFYHATSAGSEEAR